jgi:hypothetical protein
MGVLMLRFTALFLTFTMILQSTVWGTPHSTILSQKIIETAIKKYNSLSQTERKDLFLKSLDVQSPTDRRDLEPYLQEINVVAWPDLVTQGEEIEFQVQDQKISFKVVTENEVQVLNEMLSVSSKDLKTTIERLERILGQKKTSFMDLIISPAHAIIPLIALLVFVIATFCYGIYEIIHPWSFEQECKDWNKRLSKHAYDGEGSKQLEGTLSEFLQTLKRLQLENSCPKGNPQKCKGIETNLACFRRTLELVKSRNPLRINGSSRAAGKETPVKRSSSRPEAEATQH